MANSVELKLLSSGIQNPAASVISGAAFGVSHSAVPVVLAPNGTVATNGTITLGTALPLVYTSAWVRLPAGAVVGGLAGLYYVVFSSTTVGQVYTNFADPATAFTPSIPTATLVAAVGSNAAYTQATAEVTLANVTVPANSINANGSIELTVLASNNNTAGVKTIAAKFGGSNFMSVAATTTLGIQTSRKVVNRGVANQQIVLTGSTTGAVSSVAPTQLAINTQADVSVAITGTLAVATDVLVLESFGVEVWAA